MANARRNARTGAWEVRCYAGRDPATGKERRLSRTLPPDASPEQVEAAKAELARTAEFCRRGGVSWTIGGLLAYDLARLPSLGYSPTTCDGYASYLRCYVEPYVGALPMSEARPYTFSSLLSSVVSVGGKDGAPVSPATAGKLHSWLSGAFGRLAAEGVIPASPMAGVRPPKRSAGESRALPEANVPALARWLESREGDPCADAMALCLGTGLRRGELAGLRVGDFDEKSGRLRVSSVLVEARGGLARKEPKSKASKRWVYAYGATGERLARHVRMQRWKLAGEGVAQGPTTPMFAHPDGSPLRPSELTAAMRSACDACGLPKWVHLHTLRHTFATYLLASGTPVKEVQELLGHASATTTLNVYGHVVPGRKSAAAQSYAEWLDGASGR